VAAGKLLTNRAEPVGRLGVPLAGVVFETGFVVAELHLFEKGKVRLDILGLYGPSIGVIGQRRRSGGDVVGVVLQDIGERDPCVHRDPILPIDLEARDTIDRRYREFEPPPIDHLLDAEVGGHQRFSPVRRRPVGRVDGEGRPVVLDSSSELLGCIRAHPEIARIPTDDRVYRGKR
jgi:hypothetical protein